MGQALQRAAAPRLRAVPHQLTARRSTPARSALVRLANSAPRTTIVRSTLQPTPCAPARWRTGTAQACAPQRPVPTTARTDEARASLGANVRHERQTQAQLEAVRSMEGLGATPPSTTTGARRARPQLRLNSMTLALACRVACLHSPATGNRCHREVDLAWLADATQTNGRPGD
jgi:hypothetical protein